MNQKGKKTHLGAWQIQNCSPLLAPEPQAAWGCWMVQACLGQLLTLWLSSKKRFAAAVQVKAQPWHTDPGSLWSTRCSWQSPALTAAVSMGARCGMVMAFGGPLQPKPFSDTLLLPKASSSPPQLHFIPELIRKPQDLGLEGARLALVRKSFRSFPTPSSSPALTCREMFLLQ